MMTIRKLLLFLLFAIPASVSAEEVVPVSQDTEILADSLRHFDLLKEFYTNYSADGELVYEAIDPSDMTLKRISVNHGALAIRGDEMYRLSGTIYSPESLLIATPERFHLFEKSQKSGKMFVRAQGKGYQPDGYPEEWFFRLGGWEPGHIALVLRNLDPKREAKILSVIVSREGGENIATVKSSASQGRLIEHLQVTYLSDRHWAFRDYLHWLANNENNKYQWRRMHCEYQGQVNGFPILKQLVSEIGYAPFGTAAVDHQQVYDPGEEVVTQRRTLTVEHFTPGPPDLSVFDPAPILKEIGGLVKPTPPWWRVWLLALNAVFLIWLGLFCWRRSRKQGRPPHTPNTSPPPPSPS